VLFRNGAWFHGQLFASEPIAREHATHAKRTAEQDGWGAI
jgi:hypothetical protein